MSEIWIALEALGPGRGVRFIGPFGSQAEAEEYEPLVVLLNSARAADGTVVRDYPETPFREIVEAVAGETGEWRERADGARFDLIAQEPYSAVPFRHAGSVIMSGCLDHEVASRLPGGRPREHVGYVGHRWCVSDVR